MLSQKILYKSIFFCCCCKSKNDGKLYVKNLTTFLKNYLEINPFGLNSCLRSGKRISPSYIGGSNDPRKIGKLITNCHTAPGSDALIFISQVMKQSLIEVSEMFQNVGLYIDKCLYSYVYILQPLRSCSIKKCRKSTIFIGPTQRTVTVDSCVECCILTVCRRLIIRNCSACTFYTLTPASPLLLSGCDNIKFAPFNSTYSNIEEDATRSGLTESLNMWDKPTVLTQNPSLINGAHWSLMDARDFSLFSVPAEATPVNKNLLSANTLINRANVN